MAKYIVTSGSYFQPFSYDELAKPVAQAAEIHRATQDAYDQYDMEAEALRHYLDMEPEDSEARRMYDNYMAKLENLQNNLWSNGYNAQTRRDLSAARAGYASDVSRLSAAVQLRQKRSDEWGAYRREHPDAITGDNPGLASLDEYLKNDRYGSDYFVTSGNQLAQDIAADLKARGQELISDPKLMDVNLPEYYFLQTNNGFTNKQVDDAMVAVRAYFGGAGKAALSSLDPVTRVAADTIRHHIDKTGALSNVSSEEFGRTLNYAAYGASQGVGDSKIEHLENKRFGYQMQDWLDERKNDRDFNTWYQKQMIEHPEWFDENGNRIIQTAEAKSKGTPFQYLYQESPDTVKKLEELRNLFGDISEDNPLFINTEEGQKQVTNYTDAFDAVYNNEAARYIRRSFNMDVTVDPGRDQSQRSTIQGTVNGKDVVIDIMTDNLSKDERRRYGFDEDDVAIRELDKNGNPKKLNVDLTRKYNTARKRYQKYVDEVFELNKDKRLADISSKELTEFKKRNGIDMKVPSNYVMSAVRLRNLFGTLAMPTLVANGDKKKEEQAARELLGSARQNSLKPGSPFAIFRIKDGVVDYKNPVTDIGKVLSLTDDGAIDNTTGGLHSIEAAPKDIVTGRPQDTVGKLRVVTDKGTFLVDPRMFNSLVADNMKLQIMLGLSDYLEPFSNPDKIFTEPYSKSRKRLEDVMYHLGYEKPVEGVTMADIMNDEQASMEYYDMLNEYIQTAFGAIEEE